MQESKESKESKDVSAYQRKVDIGVSELTKFAFDTFEWEQENKVRIAEIKETDVKSVDQDIAKRCADLKDLCQRYAEHKIQYQGLLYGLFGCVHLSGHKATFSAETLELVRTFYQDFQACHLQWNDQMDFRDGKINVKTYGAKTELWMSVVYELSLFMQQYDSSHSSSNKQE